MIISVRSFEGTQFTLYYSPVNGCHIFRRTDGNGLYDTETTLLTDCKNQDEAISYFKSKVSFFCESKGINPDQMTKG